MQINVHLWNRSVFQSEIARAQRTQRWSWSEIEWMLIALQSLARYALGSKLLLQIEHSLTD